MLSVQKTFLILTNSNPIVQRHDYHLTLQPHHKSPNKTIELHKTIRVKFQAESCEQSDCLFHELSKWDHFITILNQILWEEVATLHDSSNKTDYINHHLPWHICHYNITTMSLDRSLQNLKNPNYIRIELINGFPPPCLFLHPNAQTTIQYYQHHCNFLQLALVDNNL